MQPVAVVTGNRWRPRTSPTPSPGRSPALHTSTWTCWCSARVPRPRSTRCSGNPRVPGG